MNSRGKLHRAECVLFHMNARNSLDAYMLMFVTSTEGKQAKGELAQTLLDERAKRCKAMRVGKP